MRSILSLRLFIVVLAATALCCFVSSTFAAPEQDSADALKEANARLAALLDDTNNLFYKKKNDENGNTFYTVVWQMDGETSNIILDLRELGHYQDKYIYALRSWTRVASSEKPLPPAAIKAVATANDQIYIGNYSCSKDFKNIYANMNGVLENATPGSIWMYCAYLHSNRVDLKKQIDQVMAGSGR